MSEARTSLRRPAARTKRRTARYWHAHLFLAVGGLFLLYPLIFSVLAGLFSTYEFATTRMSILPWPKQATFSNFRIFFAYNAKLFHIEDIYRIGDPGNKEMAQYASRYFFNSVVRSSYMTVFAVLTSLLGGYAFGRLRWPGRDRILLFLLSLETIPRVAAFLPTYVMLYRWPLAGGNNIWGQGGHGLFNSYGIYFYLFCAMNIMGSFLVRQSLQRIPIELDEAARVDGAGTFRIIFSLLAPQLKPVLGYVALTTMIVNWNDWLVPFFFTRDQKYLTLPGAITQLTALFGASMSTPHYPLIITLGLALTIPCLIVFAFFQRYMVEGLAHTGVKG